MSMAMNWREALRRGAALMGTAAMSGLPLSNALSQTRVRVRFAGYVNYRNS